MPAPRLLRRVIVWLLLYAASVIGAAAVYVVVVVASSSDTPAELYSTPGVMIDRVLGHFGWYSAFLGWLGHLGGDELYFGMALSTHLVFGVVLVYAFLFWAAIFTSLMAVARQLRVRRSAL